MIERLNNIWKSKIIYFSQNFKKIYYEIDSQLKHNIDENKVITELNNNGFFFAPSIFNSDTMKVINDEFDKLISDKSYENSTGNFKNVTQLRLKQIKLLDEKLLYFYSFFSNKFLKKIISTYFRTNHKYNHQIFFQKTSLTNKPPANEIHFDKLHQIKIWIFVNSVDENNGPIELFLGTHKKNKEKRLNFYKKQDLDLELDNRDHYKHTKGRKITGPEGSVLIFDSDLFHRASPVNEGKRLIARSHSISTTTLNFRNKQKYNH